MTIIEKFIKWTDRVEDKINVFFTWVNKEPETPAEGLKITLIMFLIFVSLFVAIGLVGS